MSLTIRYAVVSDMAELRGIFDGHHFQTRMIESNWSRILSHWCSPMMASGSAGQG